MRPLSLSEPTPRYLSLAEREEIALLRTRGFSVRGIARELRRAPSTTNCYSPPKANVLRRLVEPGQYAGRKYRSVLTEHEVACSMSRAGDCYDNTVAESFFASLKKECLSRMHLATYTEAFDAIAAYIDGFYNPVRRHSALGYISPISYEQVWSRSHPV